MGHVGILEAAHHVYNGIGGADVAQELVAQTFALGSTLHKTCNVHEFNHSRRYFFGVVELRQPIQPLVGHGNHTNVGVDGAECVVVRRHTCVGNGVEQGGLAHIG